MFEDDAPRPRQTYLLGQKLDEMSVAELEAVVVELQAEIMRVEAAKARKASHLSAAQALFNRE